jgi:hypothetical protein
MGEPDRHRLARLVEFEFGAGGIAKPFGSRIATLLPDLKARVWISLVIAPV